MFRPNSPKTECVLRALLEKGRFTQRGLARETGVSLGLVNRVVRRFVGCGCVEETGHSYRVIDTGCMRAHLGGCSRTKR